MAKVEIYTKDYCPYCTKAKMLLGQLGAEYEEIDVSRQPEKMAELLERRPSARTMPQIFIGGKGIGGCDDLYALHSAGELEGMLTVNSD
ncbi:MAG: glutaredoxin 3 [Proteobacteria bacterium]|nr:glutaredoxin 3 [Pseudomonadota bacterium]